MPIDTEVKAPIAILASSLLVFAVTGFLAEGAQGAIATLAVVGIGLALNIVFGIIALYIAAALLQIEFGDFGTAVLKLAAVFSAPAAAGALVPIEIVGWLFSIVLYWVLLAWLFSLEARDLFVSVVILFLVRLVGGVVTAMIVGGLLM